MIKQLFTLVRGRSEDAALAAMDANALSILRQQLREASAGVEQSRKALAVVMAYAGREETQLQQREAQIKSLETRALAALEQGQEELAVEASEAIAELEDEAAATRVTIKTYTAEINRLRATLKASEAQFAELKRGQRLAEANDKALKMRGAMRGRTRTDLAEAATTLRRLQERQEHATATAEALDALSTPRNAESLETRLAAAGCGEAQKTAGADVLARLKKSATEKQL